MNIKKIITASLATLLIASVGASTSNVNARRIHRHARTHRVYRHRRRGHTRRRSTWHKGAPRAIQSNYYWISKQSFRNGSRQVPRYKNVIWFQHGQVEMATENYFRYGLPKYARKHKHQRRGWLMSNGLGEWWNPHYKYVGHRTYRINCGDGYHYRVKVYNHSHVSVRWNGHYMGYFHKFSRI